MVNREQSCTNCAKIMLNTEIFKYINYKNEIHMRSRGWGPDKPAPDPGGPLYIFRLGRPGSAKLALAFAWSSISAFAFSHPFSDYNRPFAPALAPNLKVHLQCVHLLLLKFSFFGVSYNLSRHVVIHFPKI